MVLMLNQYSYSTMRGLAQIDTPRASRLVRLGNLSHNGLPATIIIQLFFVNLNFTILMYVAPWPGSDVVKCVSHCVLVAQLSPASPA